MAGQERSRLRVSLRNRAGTRRQISWRRVWWVGEKITSAVIDHICHDLHSSAKCLKVKHLHHISRDGLSSAESKTVSSWTGLFNSPTQYDKQSDLIQYSDDVEATVYTILNNQSTYKFPSDLTCESDVETTYKTIHKYQSTYEIRSIIKSLYIYIFRQVYNSIKTFSRSGNLLCIKWASNLILN